MAILGSISTSSSTLSLSRRLLLQMQGPHALCAQQFIYIDHTPIIMLLPHARPSGSQPVAGRRSRHCSSTTGRSFPATTPVWPSILTHPSSVLSYLGTLARLHRRRQSHTALPKRSTQQERTRCLQCPPSADDMTDLIGHSLLQGPQIHFGSHAGRRHVY